MASGKFGPGSVTLYIEDSPGGTTKAIHNFILGGFSARDISEMMDTTGLGDTWRERTPVGMLDSPTVTLEGWWDSTATSGSHAILGTVDDGPQDDGRELVLTLGDSKTWTRDYRISEYEVKVDTGSIHKFSCVLTPTGAAVWGP